MSCSGWCSYWLRRTLYHIRFSPIQWTSWWLVTNITNQVFEWSRSFVDSLTFHFIHFTLPAKGLYWSMSFVRSIELIADVECPKPPFSFKCLRVSVTPDWTVAVLPAIFLRATFPKNMTYDIIWPIAQPHETINLRGINMEAHEFSKVRLFQIDVFLKRWQVTMQFCALSKLELCQMMFYVVCKEMKSWTVP